MNPAIETLISTFISGGDTSIASANAIEVILDDTFPDDEHVQETVGMLARYRPGGGKFLVDEATMRQRLIATRAYLSTIILAVVASFDDDGHRTLPDSADDPAAPGARDMKDGLLKIYDVFRLAGGVTVIACDRPAPDLDWSNRRIRIVSADGEAQQELVVAGSRKVLHQTARLGQVAIEIPAPVRLGVEEARSGRWFVEP